MEAASPKISGIAVIAPKGSIILEAAGLAYIEIPALCPLKEISGVGICRICIVELKDRRLATFCVYPAEEGMGVYTSIPKVLDSRKKTLQFLLFSHNRSCLSCAHSGCYELQELVRELGVDDEGYYNGEITPSKIDTSTIRMIRDNSRCILCRRCVAVCENVRGIGVIGTNSRGFSISTGFAFEMGLGETSCVSCGRCIVVCPTGALTGKDYTADAFAAIVDPKRHAIVQTAPAVRVGLGEEFGLLIGTDVEGKMAAALRRLDFDKVFDISLSADPAIMEETHEFIDRVQNGDVLPLITSCSPDWVKYYGHYLPDMIEDLSPCRPPQQTFDAIVKPCYVEKAGIDPKDIVGANVVPCTTKKPEIGRKDEDTNGVLDVDISITTRELVRMTKRADIWFLDLPDEELDASLDLGIGTVAIPGAMGGVTEAALRTAVGTLTGKELSKPSFMEVRDTKGIKEAIYNVTGMEVRIAMTSGLGNTRGLLNKVKSGEVNYHFIEVVRCPGGCINGGDQPQQPGHVRNTMDVRGLCAKVLYDTDTADPIRRFHENPAIKELYVTYLGEPGSEKTHHLLHTAYVKRDINQH